ncbi:hypothetical protein ACJJTC_009248 [Scirpophaga incertulas]
MLLAETKILISNHLHDVPLLGGNPDLTDPTLSSSLEFDDSADVLLSLNLRLFDDALFILSVLLLRILIFAQAVHHHADEGKEPYGPACRDYFWLVCRLIDGLPEDFFKEGATSEDSGAPDLNELCEQISSSLEKREIIEKRSEPCTPDDGLYGQLSLLTHLLKHPLRFKGSERGARTLDMVFGFLFDVPTSGAT